MTKAGNQGQDRQDKSWWQDVALIVRQEQTISPFLFLKVHLQSSYEKSAEWILSGIFYNVLGCPNTAKDAEVGNVNWEKTKEAQEFGLLFQW